MKVFIDAGHGGNDPGAIGCNLYEKDITLTISKRVQHHLQRHGVTVIMSRTGDTTVSLSQRSSLANSNNVDASISIHCNAFNGTAKGVETYSYGTGANEIRLANCVHNSVISNKLYTLNRGVKQENLHMVREPQMAAILIETAFIDNSQDADLLKNRQEDFAIAIAKGILNYLGVSWKNETSTPTTSTNSDKTLYIVSAGAFSSKANAENLVNKMKEKGYNCCIHVCK